MNVRTLDRMSGSELVASGGSFGRADVMGMTGFDHGARGGGVLGARYVQENGFRPNSHYDIAQGHARIVHDLSSGVAIDAGAELYGTNWDSPGFLGEDQFARHDYDVVSNPTDGGYKRRAQERVSLRVLGSNYLWRTTVYGTEGRWQLFLTIPPAGGKFEGSGSQTEEEDSRAGAGATSAITWTLPRSEVTAGVETRWDRSRYENYFTTARRRDSTAAQVTGTQGIGRAVRSIVIRVDRSRPRRRRRPLRRAEHALDAEGRIGAELHAWRPLAQARPHRARVVVGERVRATPRADFARRTG